MIRGNCICYTTRKVGGATSPGRFWVRGFFIFLVHPANACAGVCVWCPLVSEQCTRVRSYPPGGSGDQPSRHSVSLGARPRSGLHRGSRGRRSLEGAFFRGFVSMSCRRKLATCVFRDLRSAPDENGLRPFRESPQPTVRRPSNYPAKCYCANALRRRVRFNRMNPKCPVRSWPSAGFERCFATIRRHAHTSSSME